VAKENPEEAVAPAESRPSLCPLQDGELLAKGGLLDGEIIT
jgi:hypothetical protein